jgi:hypothetical protein
VSAKLGFAAGLAIGVLAGSRAGRGLYDRSASAASAVVHDPRVRSGASAALHRAGSAGTTVAGAAARKATGRGNGKGKKVGEADGEAGRGDGGGEGDGERRVGVGGRGRKWAGAVGMTRIGDPRVAGMTRAGDPREAGLTEVGEPGVAEMTGAGDPRVAGESQVEHRVRMRRLTGGMRGHRRGTSGVAGQEQAVGGGQSRGHVFMRHSYRSSYPTNGASANGSPVRGASAPSVQAKPKGGAQGPADEGKESNGD